MIAVVLIRRWEVPRYAVESSYFSVDSRLLYELIFVIVAMEFFVAPFPDSCDHGVNGSHQLICPLVAVFAVCVDDVSCGGGDLELTACDVMPCFRQETFSSIQPTDLALVT